MKWNEYNVAVSASTEFARTNSLVRDDPETQEAENKEKLVGVGMLFDFLDFSGNNIAHGFRQIDNAFNLEARHNHFVAKLLHRHIYIHIIF